MSPQASVSPRTVAVSNAPPAREPSRSSLLIVGPQAQKPFSQNTLMKQMHSEHHHCTLQDVATSSLLLLYIVSGTSGHFLSKLAPPEKRPELHLDADAQTA
jgi:hypothetical protein